MSDSSRAVLAPANPIVEGASAAKFKQSLVDLLREGHDLVVVNLAAVPYMDSAGIGALAQGHISARNRGGRLLVIAPSPRVRTLLATTRLDQVLEISDSLDAAR